ncbi:MAG: maltotransferase domain-containing protein, partial [bacterium]
MKPGAAVCSQHHPGGCSDRKHRWRGSFVVTELGRYQYTLTAWVDRFKSWQEKLTKKLKARQAASIDLLEGAQLIEKVSQRAAKRDARTMQKWVESLRSTEVSRSAKTRLALSKKVSKLMTKYADSQFATTYPRELGVVVDREKAGFSTWYELFPHSCAPKPGQHGTFSDCQRRLPYIAEMGFDVLYFPPIHPIGHTNRKGGNNVTTANPDDPGTPWAIGSEEGGHKAVHPELGTLEDFRRLAGKAREHGIEVAL